jgi:hypothetical protein
MIHYEDPEEHETGAMELKRPTPRPSPLEGEGEEGNVPLVVFFLANSSVFAWVPRMPGQG